MAEAKKRAPNLQYQQDRDAEKVKGIFHFYERPGGVLDFRFRFYKKPIDTYSLEDNKMYELPLEVARHLNNSGRYPVHEYKLDAAGKPSQQIGKNVARYGFSSLEFTDIKDMQNTNELIPEVTRVD